MENMNAFLSMLQSVDAFFPIGSFTLSNGLESYVQLEKIMNAKELQIYIAAYMQTFPYNDLGMMYHAYLHADEEQTIIALDQICSAMKSASELRMGSKKMCIRFLKAVEIMSEKTTVEIHKANDVEGSDTWSSVSDRYISNYRKLIKSGKADGCHSIALGIYAAGQQLDLDMALGMYSYSILSAIVNNAVKLVPLSQMEGQRVLYQNIPVISRVINEVKKIDMDMLGISGCAYDIRCMQHEKLYSRLYMS